MSFAACSGNKGEAEPDSTKTDESTTAAAFDSAAALQSILDNFKADEQYAEYKAMFQSTTFEEKVEGNSIILNISGDEGVSGNYEYKLDGDYLTYTQKTDSEDYVGYSFFMYLKSAADKYLGMDSNLTTGYVSGCEAFGIENKYFITQTDEAAGTTTNKLYIAGKWDMPELDTMYVNDKALEYTEPLNEDDINGVINCGKIRVVYYGNKDSVDIIVSEYGKRSDLTYQSIVNTVKKLQPTNISVFEKYFTELKEGEDYVIPHSEGYKDDVDAESFKSKAKASFKSGVDASGDSVSVTGVSYVALIEPEFRFYVSQTNEVWCYYTKLSISDPTLTAKWIKTENGNCVSVTGLKADDFGKIFTLTIGTTELTYNGYAYLYTVLREESTVQETLKDLSKGVYKYAAAAEATFPQE